MSTTLKIRKWRSLRHLTRAQIVRLTQCVLRAARPDPLRQMAAGSIGAAEAKNGRLWRQEIRSSARGSALETRMFPTQTSPQGATGTYLGFTV